MTGCNCNGMQFIANRWVFTGECPHRREERVRAEMRQRRYLAALERKARRNTHAARDSVRAARLALEAHGERVPDWEDPTPSEA